MVYTNAQDEAQAARRTQEISRNSYNPDCSKGAGCSSTTAGNQPFRLSRENWQRRNFAGKLGEDTNVSGGTLAQLIAELEQEVIESEARLVKLHSHLQKFRLLQNQLGEE